MDQTVVEFLKNIKKKDWEWGIEPEIINELKNSRCNESNGDEIFPVIVSIAKLEHDYIEEFVKYHLALGFKYIYLYDNEDVPTYEALLHKYKDNVKVTHFPFNNYHKGIQYLILEHFVLNFMFTSKITHVAHIDIDEYIALKKHNNICDFIKEYIKDDCQGIGMNWRFFGTSGLTEKSNEPLTKRFTLCEEEKGNVVSAAIKTIYKIDNFLSYHTAHTVKLSSGHIKSTTGDVLPTFFNLNRDFSVIQINHYKCKTYPEYKYISTRQRPDLNFIDPNYNTDKDFTNYDRNDVQDLTAYLFYQKHCTND